MRITGRVVASTEGLVVPFEQGDVTRGTSFAELRDAVAGRRELFRLAGQVDAGTTIHVRGCNIGRNRAFVEMLSQAFGGSSRLEAPSHRMHFELGGQGRPPQAYFVDYTVERPGSWRASRDELRGCSRSSTRNWRSTGRTFSRR